MTAHVDRLKIRDAAGYGLGDFALNLYWGSLSFFLLYWYTDVVGLPPATAGFVFFIGTFWDALTDPTVGFLAGRNRSRWGRYRPFLFIGAIPLALSFALLLWVPPLQGIALVIALIAAHLVFRTAYTIVSVPYSALSARVSHQSKDRTTLAGARMISATTGSLLITAAGFPLVRYLGDGNERSGFFQLALLAGFVAMIILWVCFWSTSERVTPLAGAGNEEKRYELRDILTILRTNTAFLYLMLMIPFFAGAAAIMQKSLVYFVKYGLDAHDKQHIVLFVHGLAVLAATPLWAWVARRWSRRYAWLLSTVTLAAAGVTLFVLNPSELSGFLWLLLPMSIGFAAMGVLFWSMLPDTIEYGQWKNGFRAEAVFFGVASFVQKLSIGIVAWLMGSALAIAGFRPDVQQTDVALLTIKAGLALVPGLCLAVCLVILLRYPLNAELHERIQQDLAQR